MFRRSAGVRCTDTSAYKKRAFPFSCDDRSRRFEGGGDEDANAKHSGNSSCDRRLNSALHAPNTQHCHEVARASLACTSRAVGSGWETAADLEGSAAEGGGLSLRNGTVGVTEHDDAVDIAPSIAFKCFALLNFRRLQGKEGIVARAGIMWLLRLQIADIAKSGTGPSKRDCFTAGILFRKKPQRHTQADRHTCDLYGFSTID